MNDSLRTRTMLAGGATDAGNWGTIQGYSVHRELVIIDREEALASELAGLARSSTND